MRTATAYGLILWLLWPTLLHAQKAETATGVFYVKFKTTHRSPARQETLQNTGDFRLDHNPLIKGYTPLKKQGGNQRTATRSRLDHIYKISVDPALDIDSLLKVVNRYPNVEYTAPIYKEQLLYIPNDPEIGNGNQSYLDRIHAFDAWDITRGSEETVIGIIDTGLDFNHDDIKNKIYINQNEIPNNGVDDDDNQYVDDYQGYDFADMDSLAQSDGSMHGNGVGGLASAETDNETGIAGMGFYAQISPLKIFPTESNTSVGSYEAIQYASDNGYDIINLSWGSADSYSPVNQEIINYAVLEKNVIVVAAAGNTPEDVEFYPASYDHVLSVAASNLSNDEKAPFSTFNYQVDLMAPGNNIFSTTSNNGYGTDSGTSYSTPLVSGTAALAKARYPHLNAQQIMELIRVTTDEVYEEAANQQFVGKLGKGRLNAYRTLTDEPVKSVRASNVTFKNRLGDFAYYGDTISLSLDLTNFLGKIAEGKVLFSSPSPFVNFLRDEMTIGSLDTLETTTLSETLFTLTPDTPPDTLIPIRMTFQDADYDDFQYAALTTSPDYLDFGNDRLLISLTGKGDIGHFNAVDHDGSGLVWNGQNVAVQMGFFVGRSTEQVSDNLPVDADLSDFRVTKNIKMKSSPATDLVAINTFKDTTNFIVDQRIFTNMNEDFLIMEYRLVNNSPDTIKTINSGLYVDWSLGDHTKNKALSHSESGTLMAWNETGSLYGGLRTYFGDEPVHQALDIGVENGNVKDVDELTDSLIYLLGKEATYDSAGMEGAGNDVATMISQDSLSLPPFRSVKVTFLLALAADEYLLNAELDQADSLYQEILAKPNLLENFVSCEGAALSIDPVSGTLYRFYQDPLATVLLAESDTLVTGPIHSDTSFYLVNLDSIYESDIKRLDITLVSEVADFHVDPDTLFLDHPDINLVHFEDLSFRPTSWSWDFGNGLQSTNQNPTVNFGAVGAYEITLNVVNDLGCTGSMTQTLLVAERPEPPEFDLPPVCPGDEVSLSAQNTDSLALYDSPLPVHPILEGSVLEVGSFTKDTCFYLTNTSGSFESLKQKVCIEVAEISAGFSFTPDTTTTESGVVFLSSSPNATNSWYLDGESHSQEESFTLLVEKETYEISLVTTNSLGCSDSTAQTITLEISPEPTVAIAQPCIGTAATVTPENGTVFGFYADAALDSLIKKGASLSLPEVMDTLNLFIVGLDSILPSNPISAQIQPINTPATIVAEPDTLILAAGKTAQFSCTNDEIDQVKWFFNGTTEATTSPVLSFSKAEIYEIVLEAMSSAGCTVYDTLSYVVLEDEPKIILESAPERSIRVYPNPVKNKLQVESPEPINTITLSDISGKTILKNSNILKNHYELELSGFKNGIYFLTILGSDQILTIRIYKM